MIIWTTYPAEKAETLQAIRSDALLSKRSADRKLPAGQRKRTPALDLTRRPVKMQRRFRRALRGAGLERRPHRLGARARSEAGQLLRHRLR